MPFITEAHKLARAINEYRKQRPVVLAEIDKNNEEIFWLSQIENINICDYMYLMDELLDTRTRLFAMLEEGENG